MNSSWSSRGALGAAGLVVLLTGCGGKPGAGGTTDRPSAEATQAEAELLGRDLMNIVDRVMAYRSAHQNRLPGSLAQAGIDSLAPQFIRRLARQGNDPLVTVVFRRTGDRMLSGCAGTSMVLEEASLRGGEFEVVCTLVSGGTRTFTVPPLPPPKDEGS